MKTHAHTFSETPLELVEKLQRFDPFGNPESEGSRMIREGLDIWLEGRVDCFDGE